MTMPDKIYLAWVINKKAQQKTKKAINKPEPVFVFAKSKLRVNIFDYQFSTFYLQNLN